MKTSYTHDAALFSLESVRHLIQQDDISDNEYLYSTERFTLGSLIRKEFDGKNFILGDILSETAMYTRYYITYHGSDVTISGVMNVPKGDGPFPLLILNHGYIDPSIYTNGRGLRREQDYFAREGFVVLHPDYRNHADSTSDDRPEVSLRTLYTEDVINAIEAVKKADFDFIDYEKIGMLGHSMGGGITLNVISIKPELVNAAVLYAPVSGNYQNIYNRWVVDSDDATYIKKVYGTPADNSLFWQGLSAETFYDHITVPILLQQGGNDDEIPLLWSDETNRVLLDKGKDITYIVYPNGPHEFVSEWAIFMERNVSFFKSSFGLYD